MKKNLLSLSIIALFNISCFAQETIYFKKDDNKSSTTKKKKQLSTENNIIKFSPFAFVNGIVPFYYERAINETFSIQAGAGITTTNYISDIIDKASDNGSRLPQQIVWSDGITNGRTNDNVSDVLYNKKTKISYFIALEPRVYFSSEGLDGSFMGISISNARYNSTSKKVKTGSTSTSEPTFTSDLFKANQNVTDLFVSFGSQDLYDKISMEYTFAMGLRKIKGKEYAFTDTYTGGNYIFVDGVSTIDKIKFGFNISLKVGYHF
jgi:hypothetical protein